MLMLGRKKPHLSHLSDLSEKTQTAHSMRRLSPPLRHLCLRRQIRQIDRSAPKPPLNHENPTGAICPSICRKAGSRQMALSSHRPTAGGIALTADEGRGLITPSNFGTGTVVRFRSTHAVRSRGPIGSGQPNTLLLSRATPTRSMRTSDARRPTLNYRQSRKSGPRAVMLKFATALITRSPCSNAGACCETARNKVE
jgi:hypothetical protein